MLRRCQSTCRLPTWRAAAAATAAWFFWREVERGTGGLRAPPLPGRALTARASASASAAVAGGSGEGELRERSRLGPGLEARAPPPLLVLVGVGLVVRGRCCGRERSRSAAAAEAEAGLRSMRRAPRSGADEGCAGTDCGRLWAGASARAALAAAAIIRCCVGDAVPSETADRNARMTRISVIAWLRLGYRESGVGERPSRPTAKCTIGPSADDVFGRTS
mmetsp:Transcript_22797/g.74231  ORF Transcript_22797/g.74231 Transcript_22797/m.74231 type:complete len:220 (+) Transcript_22797:105-764(+)